MPDPALVVAMVVSPDSTRSFASPVMVNAPTGPLWPLRRPALSGPVWLSPGPHPLRFPLLPVLAGSLVPG